MLLAKLNLLLIILFIYHSFSDIEMGQLDSSTKDRTVGVSKSARKAKFGHDSVRKSKEDRKSKKSTGKEKESFFLNAFLKLMLFLFYF